MRILGIETSGEICGVAIVDGEGLVGELRFRHRMRLSERLLPGIEALREQVGISLGHLEGIAVSTGPGSFTGLRIGVTTAKTLAWALGVPVSGVGMLHALAAAVPAPAGARICVFLPVGSDSLAAACYARDADVLVETRAPEVLAAGQIPGWVAGVEPPACFVGLPASQRESAREAMSDGAWFVDRPEAEPRPGVVTALGRKRLQAGHGDEVETLAPLYLRPSTAEARRREALERQ